MYYSYFYMKSGVVCPQGHFLQFLGLKLLVHIVISLYI